MITAKSRTLFSFHFYEKIEASKSEHTLNRRELHLFTKFRELPNESGIA